MAMAVTVVILPLTLPMPYSRHELWITIQKRKIFWIVIPRKRVENKKTFVPVVRNSAPAPMCEDLTCQGWSQHGPCVSPCRLELEQDIMACKTSCPSLGRSLAALWGMPPSGFLSWAPSSHGTVNLPFRTAASRARTANVHLYPYVSKKRYAGQY